MVISLKLILFDKASANECLKVKPGLAVSENRRKNEEIYQSFGLQ
jgi:hypothetical protein